ncbi:MAG: SRPBCC family protein [Rhodospirillales bacterium]|nr:SRPBCC family protein [Rhodospirillales bacterium]
MLDQPNGTDELVWPTDDFTRTPYEVYVSDEIFAREQQRIFDAPTWVFQGLECELKNEGDYLTGMIGTTPIVLSKANDGQIHAFVNKCAHRGAKVVRELRGNAKFLKCLYHGWTYDNKGDLSAVPLQNGIMGQGGYPEDFKTEEHCLRKVKIDSISGVVFASLDLNAPPLEEYLGPGMSSRIKTVCHSPLKVWGYQRQTMDCNWKLFVENTRDMYHAPMLHAFIPQFGMFNPAKQKNQLLLDNDGAHSAFTTFEMEGVAAAAKGLIGKVAAPMIQKKMSSPADGNRERLVFEDPSVARGIGELEDNSYLNILSIFPASLFTVVGNALTIRQIRPLSPSKTETVYLWFTYENDDEEMLDRRVKQSNLFGPAGYVAMEDAEVMESTQQMIAKGLESGATFMEMGGRGVEKSGSHGVTETSLRGFWQAYCRYMEIPTPSTMETV